MNELELACQCDDGLENGRGIPAGTDVAHDGPVDLQRGQRKAHQIGLEGITRTKSSSENDSPREQSSCICSVISSVFSAKTLSVNSRHAACQHYLSTTGFAQRRGLATTEPVHWPHLHWPLMRARADRMARPAIMSRANQTNLPTLTTNLNNHQSVFREHLLEHLLIGDLLKYSWLNAGATLEVSQPSIDRSGHDVVLEANGVTRHVQLKSSFHLASTATQNVHVGLATKPSGCVVWIRFDSDTLALGPFLFFGGEPGAPLPSLADLKVARHAKGDATGAKKERPNVRVLPLSRFRRLDDIPALYSALFGVIELGAPATPDDNTLSETDSE